MHDIVLSILVPIMIYHNAETEKSRVITETKGKAPAEEPQALREGPGRPFPELVFIFGLIRIQIRNMLVLQ
jgi:hypothetical protein